MSSASWNAGAVDEPGLCAIATRLATAAGEGGVIYLEGDLGAGKTTFARALLTSLGVGERVKSPTYSLIETYRAGALDAHHLDLYRIADAGELEWLGLADLWTPRRRTPAGATRRRATPAISPPPGPRQNGASLELVWFAAVYLLRVRGSALAGVTIVGF